MWRRDRTGPERGEHRAFGKKIEIMSSRDHYLRLILVEDEANDGKEIVNLLRSGGCPVLVERVENATDMKRLLEEDEWDMVMARLPHEQFRPMDVLAETVRSGQDLSFLVLTDQSDEYGNEVMELLRAGARGIVSTYSPEHFRLVVGRELQDLEARRAQRYFTQRYFDSERRVRELLESSRDAIAYVKDGVYTYANQAYLKRFGFAGLWELQGELLLETIAEEDRNKVKSSLRSLTEEGPESGEGELRVQARNTDGRHFDTAMELRPTTLGGEPCVQITIREQSRSKELEERVRRLKNIDPITGLFNRQYFLRRLNAEVKRAKEGKTKGALLYIEIDNFKKVQEQLGVAVSDQLLVDIARVLRRKGNLVQGLSRFYTNIFTAVVRNCNASTVGKIAELLRAMIERHVSEIRGRSIHSTCSIGVTLINESTPSAQEALARASKACAESREAGGNRVTQFVPVVEDMAERKMQTEWVRRIRKALDEGGLRLLFQPIVSLHGEPGEKYEVLLRMSEDGQDVSPAEFIPVAHEIGLLPEVERWVIAHAIRALAERQGKGLNTKLFVKLSEDSVGDESLLLWIGQQLRRLGVDGDGLVFEIREECALDHLGVVTKLVNGLRKLGCGVALDRFGVAPNAIMLQKRLRVPYLKIDGSLITTLDENPESRERVQRINQIARETGGATIAQFVESANSLSLLWQAGVNYIQGYFVQEPSASMQYDFTGEAS